MFLASIRSMKKPHSRKITFLNALGSFGYIACLLQWFWVVMILLPPLVESPFFKLLTPGSDGSTVSEQVIETAPSQTGTAPVVVTVVAFVIGAAIIVGALYIIFVKLPRSVAKTGEAVTHKAATAISPVIVRHTHLPAKQRRQVPAMIIVVMKLLLIFLPLCLLLLAQNVELSMSFELIMVIGIVLFSWSFVLFGLQFTLSELTHTDYKTLR